MTKFAPVTNDAIRQLRREAFAAGDALQGYICHLALLDEHGQADLTDAAWLADNTCLDVSERREMTSLSPRDARRVCERVIGNGSQLVTDAARTRVERAASHIDAVSIDDDLWAHHASETGVYYVVSADELAELCDYLDNNDPAISRDAYSHWCAGTSAKEMPQGWEPGDAIAD